MKLLKYVPLVALFVVGEAAADFLGVGNWVSSAAKGVRVERARSSDSVSASDADAWVKSLPLPFGRTDTDEERRKSVFEWRNAIQKVCEGSKFGWDCTFPYDRSVNEVLFNADHGCQVLGLNTLPLCMQYAKNWFDLSPTDRNGETIKNWLLTADRPFSKAHVFNENDYNVMLASWLKKYAKCLLNGTEDAACRDFVGCVAVLSANFDKTIDVRNYFDQEDSEAEKVCSRVYSVLDKTGKPTVPVAIPVAIPVPAGKQVPFARVAVPVKSHRKQIPGISKEI